MATRKRRKQTQEHVTKTTSTNVVMQMPVEKRKILYRLVRMGLITVFFLDFCFPELSLANDHYQFNLLGSYEFDVPVEGKPLLGDDGLIWVFDTNGHLHRAFKASKNRKVNMAQSLAPKVGVKAATAKFGSKIFVGTAGGDYYCYDSNTGNCILSGKAQGENSSFLLTQPIAQNSGPAHVFFVSDGGYPYVLDENGKQAKQLLPFGDLAISPGFITASPALFTVPEPTLVYTTLLEAGVQKRNYYLNLVSKDGGLLQVKLPGACSFPPLVTEIAGSQTALFVSDSGQVYQTGSGARARNSFWWI